MVLHHLRRLDGLTPQNDTTDENNIDQIILYLWSVVAILTLVGFVLYDRRQGYPRIVYVRDGILKLWRRIREFIAKHKKPQKKGGQKISGEEQPNSSKGTLITFELQKTIADADPISIQQTANSTPTLSDEFRNQMHIEDQTPQVDLKEMFEKDKKGKDKSKGKSKSKLRDRVKIKKSELQAEANEEENPCDLSADVQKSVDGIEE